jgi:hypothetical protein
MLIIENAAHTITPIQTTTMKMSRVRCQFIRSIRFCLGSIKITSSSNILAGIGQKRKLKR